MSERLEKTRQQALICFADKDSLKLDMQEALRELEAAVRAEALEEAATKITSRGMIGAGRRELAAALHSLASKEER